MVSTPVVGTGTISVVAVNACGSSAPFSAEFTVNDALPVDLGPDTTICLGQYVTLDATTPGALYLWSPGNVFNATITDAPEQTTTYHVAVTNSNGCYAIDAITVIVSPCLGVHGNEMENIAVWPVPVTRGDHLRVEGINAADLLGIASTDGRAWPVHMRTQESVVLLNVDALPPGTFVLRTTAGAAMRFVVVE